MKEVHFSLFSPNMIVKGWLLQVMPLSGFLVSKLLNLPSYYAAGLILVGCCPGGMYLLVCAYVTFQFNSHCPLYIYIFFFLVAGTASNIVTYIARFVEFSKDCIIEFFGFFFCLTFFPFSPHVCHGRKF